MRRMSYTLHFAETEEERDRIYRLRYGVYVEEMRIFGDVADHERKVLIGGNDAHARLLYAKCGDEIVASIRLNLGIDAPFSDELEQTYKLSRFRPTLSDKQMLVLTRFMVKDGYRGGNLAFLMIEEVARLCVREGIEMALCDCQPHLIRFYRRMGFRSYECPVYNDPEFGIMIPLAFVIRDLKYLDAIRSPLRKALNQSIDDYDAVLRTCRLLGKESVVEFSEMDDRIEGILNSAIRDTKTTVFDGLNEEDIRSILANGYVLKLSEGCRLIREEQMTSTMFLVLEGDLEVRHEGRPPIRRVSKGAIIGEFSLLLNSRRTADVYVCSREAILLSLDDGRLRKKIKSRSRSGVLFLHNLCKILISKVQSVLWPHPDSATQYPIQ